MLLCQAALRAVEPDPSFQVAEVKLRAVEPDVLEVAFTAKGDISPEAARDGWFAVYLDLDGNPATGKPLHGGLGCDLVLRIEPIPSESCWTGVSDVGSEIDKAPKVEVISTVVQGKTITAQFRSELFRKHPSFSYVAASFTQGKVIDKIPADPKAAPLLFPATAKP
jgi:hypothetical protein